MHTLEHAMKQVVPGALHLVVAERVADGQVGVIHTRKPQEFLSSIAATAQLARVEVRPGVAAGKVVDSMAGRYALSITSRSHNTFWTMADFEEVIAAIDEYNLDRGVLVERAGVKLDDPVFVSRMGRGVVTGFTRCGRVVVRLARANGLAEVGVISPRSMVKPIVRVPLQ